MRSSQVKSDLFEKNSMCKGPEARENMVYWKKRQLLSVAGSWNMTGDWEMSGLGGLGSVSLGIKQLRLS